jgi:ParB family transcriptional regulator, chromosome partitioning protein
VKNRLSVREAEALVKKKSGKKDAKAKTQPAADADQRDLMERIQRHFGAKVALRLSGRGGKLEISFADQKELARIVEILNL